MPSLASVTLVPHDDISIRDIARCLNAGRRTDRVKRGPVAAMSSQVRPEFR